MYSNSKQERIEEKKNGKTEKLCEKVCLLTRVSFFHKQDKINLLEIIFIYAVQDDASDLETDYENPYQNFKDSRITDKKSNNTIRKLIEFSVRIKDHFKSNL